MAIVQDLIDEFHTLANARMPWELYWRDVARYVLPQTEGFDMILQGSLGPIIDNVMQTPVSADKSKDIYDTTSLWGVERLTAGLLSLKTPETEHWHDLGTDDLFGEDNTHEEQVALERLRDYLFKVRSNPRSGFWGAHRSALKSMCGFGDGWAYVEDIPGGGARTPFRYEYMRLSELYPGVGPDGVPNRMFRCSLLSAEQLAKKFGYEKLSAKVQQMVQDPKLKHNMVKLLHGVRPREDSDRGGRMGVKGAAFGSYYCLPDEKHLIGDGGYYEFPFIRYAWANSGTRPFSEGPIAFALAEVKSLQEMSKNELLAVQSVLRPAYGTAGKNFVRLNFNPGAVNPNLVSADGRPLFQPLNAGARPDFAQAVLEQRRNQVREMLYLNLWQILLQDTQDTATEALIKAQEKGELLGPVGISLNHGLAMMVDREVAILGRKRAFDDGSPLAMPDSMANANVTPEFNSPLDRLRRVGEVVGMQRLVEFATLLAGGDPQQAAAIMARFDVDEMLERAQAVLGAPVKVLKPREEAENARSTGEQLQQMMTMLAAMQGGGEAARSMGEGAAALAQGTEIAGRSPALRTLTQAAPQIGSAMQAGARQAAVPA